MSDREIIRLLGLHDEAAIREADIKYGSYIMNIAVNILGDQEDAREVLNDTLLALWNSGPGQDLTTMKTWLARVARRIAIDRLRKKTSIKRKVSEYSLCRSELEELLPGGTDPEDAAAYAALCESIQTFLKQLPVKDRDFFIGRYFYFDSLKDIALYCRTDEKKVKSRLYRIRQELKKYLNAEGYEL